MIFPFRTHEMLKRVPLISIRLQQYYPSQKTGNSIFEVDELERELLGSKHEDIRFRLESLNA